jgi:transposase InsO family protein
LHFIWDSAQTGENSKRLIHHMLSSFAIMGIPQQIKTDNGRTFTSYQFYTFCTHSEIAHHMGIPHNSQGQGIIERTHQTLKAQLLKQKATTYPPSCTVNDGSDYPKHILHLQKLQTSSYLAPLAYTKISHPPPPILV